MTGELKMKKAQEMFKSMCEALDEKELNYERQDEDLAVTFIMSGDDLPMHFILTVDADRELVRLLSPLPVIFDSEKRLDGAIATCQVNNRLVDGSFDYDYENGTVIFRMTSSYTDSLISKDIFDYMVFIACVTIDEFNDKFALLAKDMLDLEYFLKTE